jgi:hypothetical protein
VILISHRHTGFLNNVKDDGLVRLGQRKPRRIGNYIAKLKSGRDKQNSERTVPRQIDAKTFLSFVTGCECFAV